MISFACPACGKKLNVKDEVAGKKVKCPGCAQAIPVPVGSGKAKIPDGSIQLKELTPVPRPRDEEEDSSSTPYGLAADESMPDGARTGSSGGFNFLRPPESGGEIGRLGSYRILKVLGQGGMGVVFAGEDPQLQRKVAIKAMLPELAGVDTAKERFFREARAAAGLKHPHIVSIYQVGEEKGAPFLAMEFLEGESLQDCLDRKGKLPIPEVLRIGREIADGLAAAHEKGLIHRDIKPANIWLEAPGATAKILDFGLARATKEKGQLTQSGAILGTPAYMAPEQAAGQRADHRADLFSLGCVLYCMACGRRPFDGADIMSLLTAIAVLDPTPPSDINPAVPSELCDLIMELLAKKPGERPQSADDVFTRLKQLRKKQKSAPNNRLTTQLVGGGLALVGLGLISIALMSSGGSKNEAENKPPGDPAPPAAVAQVEPKESTPAAKTEPKATPTTEPKPSPKTEPKPPATPVKEEPAKPAVLEPAKLIAQLGHKTPEQRATAATLIWESGIKSPEAVTALTRCLSDTSADVRRSAAVALGKIGKPSADALPDLTLLLKDQDDSIRLEAVRAVSSIGPKGSDLAAALGEIAGDAALELREQSLVTLTKMGADAKHALPGLKKAVEGGDAKLHKLALVVIEQLGGEGRETAPAVQKLLKSNDAETKNRALRMLVNWSKTSDTAKLLIPELTKNLSADKTTCLETLKTLQSLGKAGGPAAVEIEKLYRRQKDQDIRFQSLYTLGAMGPAAKEAVPVLVRDIQDQQLRFSDKALHDQVRQTLVKIGPPAAEALARTLADSKLPQRTIALEIIYDIGPEAAAVALPILTQHRETTPEAQKLLRSTIEQLRR